MEDARHVSLAGLDRLGQGLLLDAFRRMGTLDRPGERAPRRRLEERLGVASQHRRLLGALWDLLAAAGFVRLEGGDVVASWDSLPDLEGMRAGLLARSPELRPYVDLLQACLAGYPAILRGELPATEVLFPGSSLERVAGIYRGNPHADRFNQRIARAVETHLRLRRAKGAAPERLRVLEIGAGTGGSTGAVLEVLASWPGTVRYDYTDVSLAFVRHGARVFGKTHPCVQPGILDIQEDPESQGFPPGSCDLVIAANVLHATRRLRDSVRNAKSLLRKNGWLILSEPVRVSGFLTLTFGLLKDWWAFEDEPLRLPGSPLAGRETWERLLAEEGFGVAIPGGGPGSDEEVYGQAVILAESDGRIERVERPARPAVSPAREAEPPAVPVRSGPADRSPLETTVLDVLEGVLQIPRAQLDPDAPFTDFGVDSILAVEVIDGINGRLGLELKTTDLFNYPTVTALVGHVLAQHGALLAPIPQPAAQEVPRETLRQTVAAGILEELARVLQIPRAQFDAETPFSEFGVDSILAVEVIDGINGRLGLELKATDLFNHPTVTALVDHVLAQQGDLLASPPAPAPVRREEPRVEESRPPAAARRGDEIAVIGMSAAFPGAPDLGALWQVLAEGASTIREVPQERWDVDRVYDPDRHAPDRTYSRWGGFLAGAELFDPLFFNISPKEAEIMDPQQRLFLQQAWWALEDAGYSDRALSEVRCGVFAGCGAGDYRQRLKDARVRPDAYYFLGNSSSVLPARISYFLNLKGPSLSVDTACSSSLVAIHLACESLRNGTSDMAVAGGVALLTTPEFHVLASRSGMLSPDSRCRPFDRSASGFVPGEGVGAVVLKRLEDAVRDGDRVHGVLCGSEINQDGRTNGLTAPSGPAQTALECAVYDKYGIRPDEITFVEAHGTGTVLGDPIEVDALTAAFRRYTGRRQFCALGSVKSNLGHTLSAAGLAGLLKVLLCLRERKLVPTVHFESPNERIRFEDSPFYVNTALRDWEVPGGLPRMAAVSSFGFSGTNAHLVVREPLGGETAARGRTRQAWSFVPLSAKTPAALAAKIADLAAWLDGRESLDDIAHAHQAGRSHFALRAGFVAADVDGLRRAVREVLDGRSPEGYLAGGGASAERVPSLDEEVRRLAGELARPEDLAAGVLRERLLELGSLYVRGCAIDWPALGLGAGCGRISVPLYPFERLRCWVETGEEGAPALFLTGEEPYLRDHRVHGDRVLPAVASLEMARAAGERASGRPVRRIRGAVWPRPLVVPGGGLRTELRMTPREDGLEYELRSLGSEGGVFTVHAQGRLDLEGPGEPVPAPALVDLEAVRKRCGTVLDGQGMYVRMSALGLSLGPAFQVIEEIRISGREALSLLRAGREPREHPWLLLDGALQTAAGLFGGDLGSVCIPFVFGEVELLGPAGEAVYGYATLADGSGSALPCFDACLLDAEGRVLIAVWRALVKPFAKGKANEEPVSLYHRAVWRQEPPAPWTGAGETLLFDADGRFLDELQSVLGSAGAVTLVTPGPSFRRLGERRFEIDPARPEDHAALVEALAGERPLPERAAWLWSRSAGPEVTLQERLERGLYSVSALVQAVLRRSRHPRLSLLFAYGAEDPWQPAHAALGGFARSLRLEEPGVDLVTLELGGGEPSRSPAEAVLSELGSGARGGREVRYRDGRRWVRHLEEFEPSAVLDAPLRPGGVYLVTGGTGRLGRLVAGHLARETRGTIVLSGRSPRSEATDTCQERLRELGAETVYLQADLADGAAVAALVSGIRSRFGRLHGIFHVAGETRDGLLESKSRSDFEEVLAAKVHGTLLLDEAAAGEPLDLLVLFSSIAGALGNRGQCDYAFANSFLDAFAERRESLRREGQRSGRTLSVGWPLWREGAMVVDATTEDLLAGSLGLQPLETEAGLEALGHALRSGESRIAVLHGSPEKIRRTLAGAAPPRRADGPGSGAALPERVLEALLAVVPASIKVPREDFDPDRSLPEYGFDSIGLTELANDLGRRFGIAVTPAYFFEYPTLRAFAGYLAAEQGGAFRELPAVAAPAPVPPVTGAERDGIAVVGIAGVMPQCEDLERFWESLRRGEDLITEVPADRWDWRALYGDPSGPENRTRVKWGGFLREVDKFDAAFFGISPREAELMDPQQRIFLQAVWEVVENAGLRASSLAGTRTGMYVGVSTSDYRDVLRDADLELEPYAATGMSAAMLPNRISYLLDLRGPSEAIDTACSSSLVAIHRAVEALRSGACDLAVAGGVSCILTPALTVSFSKAGMLSEDGRCKTFDRRADGYVRGEGCGAVLLKRLGDALRDGDFIHAVIRGTAENHGGRAASLTAPNPSAQAGVLIAAYEDAGIDPGTVTYVEAHGTGTALGDPIEVNGLKKAFLELYRRNGRSWPGESRCGLGSVKTSIGHLEAAAGIAGFLKVVLSLWHGELPGNLHFRDLNPHIELADSPFYVVRDTGSWERLEDSSGRPLPRRAGVSSFGFGGSNVHLVVEEHQDARPAPAGTDLQVIVLSARNGERLRDAAGRLLSWLERGGLRSPYGLADLAWTLRTGREPMVARLAVVARSQEELTGKLSRFLEGDAAGVWCGNVRRGQEGQRDPRAAAGGTDRERAERLAELWVQGAEVDWSALPEGRRIPLPGYPFARERHWIGKAAVPSTGSRAAAVLRDALRTVAVPAVNGVQARRYRSVIESLDGFSHLAVLGALQRMGAFAPGGPARSRESLRRDLKIAPHYHRLFDSLLDVLQRAGFLAGGDGALTATSRLADPETARALAGLDERREALVAELPELEVILGLIQVATGAYPEVLTGRKNAMEILFPAGSTSRMERLYRGDEVADTYNRLVADVVRGHVERRLESDPGTRVEILEVGAGTGGTSAFVLEALKPFGERVRYVYSDVSPGFLDHGRRAFGGRYPFLDWRVVDLEEPPAGAAGTADLVLGSNVFHATRSIPRVLANVRGLLKPEGLLVINEATEARDYMSASFGLLAGWWLFEDAENRFPNSPLLHVRDWRRLLEEAGFQAVEVLQALDGDGRPAFDQSLVVGARSVPAAAHPEPVSTRPAVPARPAAPAPPPRAGGERAVAYVKATLAEVLKMDAARIDEEEDLHSYGIDSLVGMKIANRLAADLGELAPTALLEHLSVRELTDYLLAEHGEALSRVLGPGPEVPPPPAAPEPREFRPEARPAGDGRGAGAVAVIGVAGRYPGARDVRALWEQLLAGRDCATEVPASRWDWRRYFDEDPERAREGRSYGRWGAFLEDVDAFDPLFFNISPAEAECLDPQERLFLEVAWEAFESAGYAPGGIPVDTGVFAGVGALDYGLLLFEEQAKRSEVYARSSLASIANRVSYVFNLQGPSLPVSTMCSSSLTAVHLACASLRQGECRMALAGGVNLYLHPSRFVDLSRMRMLSRDGRTKSFAVDGDGFVPGEGVGAVLLKPLEDALRDGDPVLAVIRGSAINNVGKSNGYMVPNPKVQEELIAQAIERAGVDARTISYVEAQGIGSALADVAESTALVRAFRRWTGDDRFCALGSIKPNIGHLEAASGISQLTKVLLQLEHGTLAPTRGEGPLLPGADGSGSPFLVHREPGPWAAREHPRRAVISSFGGGGSGACLVVEEGPRREAREAAPADREVLVLSARTEESLRASTRNLAAWLREQRPLAGSEVSLADVAWTLQSGRQAMARRLALAASSFEEAAQALEAYLEDPAKGPAASVLTGDAGTRNGLNALVAGPLGREILDLIVASGDSARLALLWVHGGDVAWDRVPRRVTPRRIPLPTYPFAKERYWIGRDGQDPARAFPAPPTPSGHPSLVGDLANLAAEVLGLPPEVLGPGEDLRSYGFDSLLELRLINRIEERYGRRLPAGSILAQGSVEALARHWHEEALPALEEELPAAAPERGGVTAGQRALWLLHQLYPGHSAYNVPLAVRLRGPMRWDAFENALRALVGRHEALRTSFEGEEEPVQVVWPGAPFALRREDASDLSERELAGLLRETGRQPFDLRKAPLLRVHVFTRGEAEAVVLFTFHHIIFDGASMAVFFNELGRLYRAEVTGRPDALPELRASFQDFVRWERELLAGEAGARHREAWRAELDRGLPALRLPADLPPSKRRDLEGEVFGFEMPEEALRGLRELARSEGVSLFVLFLAAFDILLYRYTGQEDVALGTAVARRPRTELEGVLGYFTNLVPVRAQVSGELTVRELLARLHGKVLRAIEHGDYPFSELLEAAEGPEGEGRQGVQAALAMQSWTRALDGSWGQPAGSGAAALAVEPMLEIQESGELDLALEAIETGPRCLLFFKYNPTLFSEERIGQLAAHLVRILGGIARQPGLEVRHLDLLSPEERHEITIAANEITASFPGSSLVPLFEHQVSRGPGRIALTWEGENVTYAALDAWANHLARQILSSGVAPGSIVAIGAERSPALLAGLLGILKAGCAYLPVEPAYPEERIRFMLGDSGAPALLAGTGIDPGALGFVGAVIPLEEEGPGPEAVESPGLEIRGDALAYVLYTSGTTGVPKGVAVEHRDVVQLLLSDQLPFDFTEGDVWSLFHSCAFDFSVWEMFGALLFGGRLVVVPSEVARDPAAFLDLLEREGVTVLNQTPSAFARLVEEDLAGSPRGLAVRYVVFGGEALRPAVLGRWRERYPRVSLINMLGVTEATVHSTLREIGPEDVEENRSRVGRRLPTVRTYVLDPAGNPVPPGGIGELYIGGWGVARGYLNREELDRRKFVPDPFRPGERLYRSGDLVRVETGGEMEYLGRLDDQVKIRGFRIELGEVEAALLHASGVAYAAVLARGKDGEETRLVACLVPEPGARLDAAELRGALSLRLPDYMVPATFIELDALPLTPSGKVDRRALAALDAPAVQATEGFAAPGTDTEKVLAAIWEEVLDIQPIGLRDSFFTLGGDSVRTYAVLKRCRERGWRFSAVDLFREETIEKLARFVDAASGPAKPAQPSPAAAASGPAPEPVQDEYPATRMQELMLAKYAAGWGKGVYHFQQSFCLRDESFDPGAFQRAVDVLVAENPSLRTGFRRNGDGRLIQVVKEGAVCRCEVEEGDRPIEEVFREDLSQPFDTLGAGEGLLRLRALRRPGGVVEIFKSQHHAITDGWSNILFNNRLFELYASLKAGEDPEPAVPAVNACRELAEIEQKIVAEGAARPFWMEIAAACGQGLAYRNGSLAEAAASFELPIGKQRVAEIEGAARRWRTSPKALFLQAYLEALAQVLGPESACTGVVTNGRTDDLTDPLSQMGLFWNLVPFRTAGRAANVRDAVQEVHELLLAIDSRHGRYPLGQILADAGGRELFDATFNYVHFHHARPSLANVWGVRSFDRYHYPLNAIVHRHPFTGSTAAVLVYEPGAFEDAVVRRIARTFRKNLGKIAAA